MRVLLVHNHYRSSAPSGENQVFELERALLARCGHEVATLERRSDELARLGPLGALAGALATPWNPLAARAVRAEAARFRPDVLHAHNTFPLLSPAIFRAAGPRTARVLTLHNFRIFCAGAIPLRDGQPCTRCLDERSAWPAIRFGCYRESRLATLPVAIGVALHRRLRTWEAHVDAFVALTGFQRDLLVRAGLPAGRVHVKPNFFPGTPHPLPWDLRDRHALFVGRLGVEKGVRELLDAWAAWGDGAPELRLVGDGPLRVELEERVRAHRLARVRFLGQIPAAQAQAEIAHASLLIIPSICFEGFPLVLREAFALGTPVAASALGPLPDLLRTGRAGVLFPPRDPAGLLAAVRTAWAAPETLRDLCTAGRAEYEASCTEAASATRLAEIYEAALMVRRARRVQ